MPKLKTHKGTAKRMKITRTGKVLRRSASIGHFLHKKKRGQQRDNKIPKTVEGKAAKNIKRALGV